MARAKLQLLAREAFPMILQMIIVLLIITYCPIAAR